MNSPWILICTLCAIVCVFVNAEECDESKCPSYGLSHYPELGCTPIKGPDGCCAERFECPQLEQRLANPDKCYYKDKAYAARESIPNELTSPICSASCFCDTRDQTVGQFTCAQIECPDLFGHKPKPGCHFTYETSSCCSRGEYCPQKERSEIEKKCTHDGKDYYEGQRVYRDCETCVCKSGELDCRALDCGIDLRRAAELAKGGAPVYYGRGKCQCPIGIVYSTDKIEVVPGVGSSSEHKCKLGEKQLNIGDSVVAENQNKCVKCKCEVPPFVTCIQDPDCEY